MINSWASEVADFEYNVSTSQMVGHYTQIVFNGVSRVGCGAALCGTNYYAYCNYVSGQFNFLTPYTHGNACLACPSGKCVDNQCNCGLVCQNGGTLGRSTLEGYVMRDSLVL